MSAAAAVRAPPDRARRVLGWAGAALGGTVARMALLVGSTAVLGRLLPPAEFGAATLALSVVAVLVVFAGGPPFEDALTQKRRLTRRDLGAAVAASWALGAAFVAGVALAGPRIEALVGVPDFAFLLTLGCATLFFQAPLTVTTAYARRRRRFNAVALADTVGAAAGAAAALVTVAFRPGPEALVAQRVAMAAGGCLTLGLLLGVAIRPRFSPAALRQISRYSAYSLSQKLVEDLSYLATNAFVGALFGLTALGHLNMAMRIIEPVRGATLAISHNLAFPHIRGALGDAATVAARARGAAAAVALATAPVLLGLAAVSPLLLPILVGPGWDDAVWNAMALAVGASVTLPFGMVMTAAAAVGRPEFLLHRRLVGLAALAAALPGLATTPLRFVAPGLGRAAADVVESLHAVAVYRGALGGPIGALLGDAVPPWAVAAGMAVAAWAIGQGVAAAAPLPVALACAAAAGVLIYVAGLALAAPRAFALVRRLAGRG